MSKIYILEDNKVLVTVISKHLKKAGLQTEVFERGEEILEAVEKEKPDLIICDIMVPGINGLEVSKKIKENPQWNNIPIVILTALADPHLKEEAQEIGVEKFFYKSKLVLATFIKEVKGLVLPFSS